MHEDHLIVKVVFLSGMLYTYSNKGCRKWGIGGQHAPLLEISDLVTLFQPGADYVPLVTTRPHPPQIFRPSDIPALILKRLHCRVNEAHIFSGG